METYIIISVILFLLWCIIVLLAKLIKQLAHRITELERLTGREDVKTWLISSVYCKHAIVEMVPFGHGTQTEMVTACGRSTDGEGLCESRTCPLRAAEKGEESE